MDNYIFKNNNNVLKNKNLILQNSTSLRIINNTLYFPDVDFPLNYTSFALDFSQATIIDIIVDNLFLASYSTNYIASENVYRVEFYEPNSSGITNSNPTYSKITFVGLKTRNIEFKFNKSILVGIKGFNMKLPLQNLNFNFSSYINLEKFDFQVIESSQGMGSINLLNLNNLFNPKIKYLGFRRIFSPTSANYRVLPLNIFDLPLVELHIGGNYTNYGISNAGLIGTKLNTTLEKLTFSVPIDNSEGLPSSFSTLTKLKYFNISSIVGSSNLIRFPSLINSWTNLEEFILSINNPSLTGFDCNFINFLKLKSLNLSVSINTITDFGFINQLQKNIKFLDFRGLVNQSILDNLVNLIYSMVKIKSSIIDNSYRNMIIRLESIIGSVSAIPTGTYQSPIVIGSPATPKEAIWEMNNIYGCTVTYRAS